MPKSKKAQSKEVPQKVETQASIPAGAVPQIVGQRIYDYIPVFYEALKEVHKELVAIKEILKEA